MACGVAKEIGAKAASLRGHVDAITIVGSWTMFEEFVEMIKSMVKWIAPVKAYRYAGESMTLALSAASVYYGTHKILVYGADRCCQQ
jgi:butyrate kinase